MNILKIIFGLSKNKTEDKHDGRLNIVDLASNINLQYNSGNWQQASELATLLYNEVGPNKQGGKALLKLTAEDCQCVGFAFAFIATELSYDDEDINSVAAENAYYCLAKSYIKKNNIFCLPAIYTILDKNTNLLKDKLLSAYGNAINSSTNISLGTQGIFAMRSRDGSMLASLLSEHLKYYVANKFYNTKNREFSIPTEYIMFLPDKNMVDAFIAGRDAASSIMQIDYEKSGKEIFERVFKDCEKTLQQF